MIKKFSKRIIYIARLFIICLSTDKSVSMGSDESVSYENKKGLPVSHTVSLFYFTQTINLSNTASPFAQREIHRVVVMMQIEIHKILIINCLKREMLELSGTFYTNFEW
jgi:hypothetical protein